MYSRISNSTKNQYSDRLARPLNTAYLRKHVAIAWPKPMLDPPSSYVSIAPSAAAAPGMAPRMAMKTRKNTTAYTADAPSATGVTQII